MKRPKRQRVKGKNFSRNNRGQRRKSDAYQTPYSITEQGLKVFGLKDRAGLSILEPAAGAGAMVSVLRDYYKKSTVEEYDLETNFLTESRKGQFDCIITNPPYSLAAEFIQKAKELNPKMFAFLMPLSYLHGKGRYETLYKPTVKFRLANVFVFVRYPMLGDALRLDGKYRTGMMTYAWFVWKRTHKGNPTVGWIDNTDYVLGARK